MHSLIVATLHDIQAATCACYNSGDQHISSTLSYMFSLFVYSEWTPLEVLIYVHVHVHQLLMVDVFMIINIIHIVDLVSSSCT
jgi:hypothetical protein